jgi:hypothetical protein
MRFSKYLLAAILFLAFACRPTAGIDGSITEEVPLETVKKELTEKAKDPTSTYNDLIHCVKEMAPFLSKNKKIDDFEFSANYRPHIFLALVNNDSIDQNSKIDKAVLSQTDEYHKLHYIQFSIENTKFKSELLRYNLASADDYSQRISYYAFQVKNDICLIENSKDTIKGSFVNFERTFDISPKLNLTFVFERKSDAPLNKLTFVFNDIIFNNGKINFEFDYNKIAFLNSPEVKKLAL